MEQPQYWLGMRRRQLLKSHFQVSMNSLSESWEEKAFAEDAVGSLGGCIWPPRSYSCSFCRREFRSAQALGGHMNVHRRDRARLKQSLSHTNTEEIVVPHHQNHNQTNHLDQNFIASTFSASRISDVSTQKNFSSAISSSVQEQQKGSLFGSDTTAKRSLTNVISGSKAEAAEKNIKLAVGEDSLCLGSDDDDRVETNLSVGLNPVFFQNLPTVSCGEEAISCNKRPKINTVSTLPFFVSKEKACSLLQWQVLGLKPVAGSMDDLDLELRLGSVLPKVQ